MKRSFSYVQLFCIRVPLKHMDSNIELFRDYTLLVQSAEVLYIEDLT